MNLPEKPPEAGSATAIIDPFADIRHALRLTTAITLAGFAALLIWGLLAPISGAVIVPGEFKIDFYRKTVQHLEGGIVKQVLVKSGDKVRAGQPLVMLEDVQVSSTVEASLDQFRAELAKEARLTAEKDGKPAISFPAELQQLENDPKVRPILQAERNLFAARRGFLDNQIRLLRKQSQEASVQIRDQEAQVESANRNLALLNEELGMNQKLFEKRYVDYPKVLALKRAIAEKEEKRGEYLTGISSARQRGLDAELKIAGLHDEFVRTVADELKETRKKVVELRQQLRPNLDALQRRTITSPADGAVVDLKIFTAGGVITPGQALMDIVPENNILLFEGRIATRDIDDVHMGAKVEVELSAFARRSTPLVEGELIFVSADVLKDDRQQPPNNEYYLIQAKIDSAALSKLSNVKLTPGMPATAFIKTRERTPIEYLVQPITDVLRRSFREP
jgi:HlyD family type I secretion membrane fusion protein